MEIITLQLGHVSNYIGTHLWNTQDVYSDSIVNHNVLFRSTDSTYSPRLVALDKKGSLGSLLNSTVLADSMLWSDEKTMRINHPPILKNSFISNLENGTLDGSYSNDLSNSVSVWSDFNKLFYHPKSILEMSAYQHENTIVPFSTYTQGREAFSDPEMYESFIETSLRFFIEESDNLQGFHVFSDVCDGFSGFTGDLLEYLRDELPKSMILTFGVSEPIQKSIKHVNVSNYSLKFY